MDYLVKGYDTLIEAWHDGQKIKAIKGLRSMHPKSSRWTKSEDGSVKSSATIGLKAAKDALEYAGRTPYEWTDQQLWLLAFNLTGHGDGIMFPKVRVLYPR